MKGDFSRNSFDPHKQYNSVRWQQGRPVTDADENEAQDIARYLAKTQSGDVIGAAGAPKGNAGFALTSDGAGGLLIGAGRFYVDGILCENDAPTPYADQPRLPNPPALTSLLADGELGLAYLDVFERHITFHDDDAIRDSALNGVDTTTRLQTVWQVKVLPLPGVPLSAADCAAGFAAWDALTAPPSGTLEAGAIPVDPVTDPCDVPPGGGYTRGENQYYIIQVHSVPGDGTRNGATFKWSRDNGSVVALLRAFGSNTSGVHTGVTFDVDSVRKDDYLGFKNGDWVEYVDDTLALNHQAGPLLQVTNADANANRITLNAALTVNLDAHAKLRKWDGAALPMNTSDDPFLLEAGIQIEFGSGVFRPGDYWQFAARSTTGKIDFPAGPQAPAGVRRHFARLGFVTNQAGSIQPLADCRPLFPPLTTITAEDVSFDDSNCALGAETVQEAIDALCARTGGGSCTLTVSPGPEWFIVFDLIPEGADAEICLSVGDYPLAEPVVVRGKGHLLLHGAGKGTRLLANNAESALVFEACASVTVRDLTAIARTTGGGQGGPVETHIHGVLTMLDCGATTIEHVAAQCASAGDLRASCITVRNDTGKEFGAMSGAGVRIEHCDLRVGHHQAGILVVNAPRAHIADNFIRANRRPPALTFEILLQSRKYRAAIRHLLLHKVDLNPSDAQGNRNRVIIAANNLRVSFHTPAQLTESWQALFRLVPHQGVQNPRELYFHLKNIAERLLIHGGQYPGVEAALTQPFVDWFENLRRSLQTAFEVGITVAGERGRQVYIANNTIQGAMVGVKTALSHDAPPDAPFDSFDSVDIRNNEITLLLAPSARMRFGIWAGSAERIMVDDNHITVRRLEPTEDLPVDGIRLFGEYGDKLLARGNSISNADIGIRVHPIGLIDKKRLWLVAENVMVDAGLLLGGGIMQRENVFG